MSATRLARAGLALVCLLLGLPAGAAAVDVNGTTAKLGWSPASGPVAAYGVFVSRNGSGFSTTPNQFVTTPQVTLNGAVGDTVVVRVAAYDVTGTKGPESPSSDTLRFAAVSTPPPPSPPPPPPASEGNPALTVSTTTLDAYVVQGENGAGQSFTLRNVGGGTASYLAANSQDWIVLSTRSGTVTNETDTIGVGFATAGLPAGTHTGVITVVQTGAAPTEKYITVNLVVGNTPPSISVTPARLTLTVDAGANPAIAGFLVSNAGGGTLSYSIDSSASWLLPVTTSGTSSGESDAIGVAFATASLAPGSYTGTLTVRGGPGVAPKPVEVSLTVKSSVPSIGLSSSTVTATAEKGQNAPASAFAIRNSGGGSLEYSVLENVPWLSVTPSSGRSSGGYNVTTVSYLTSGLAPGNYQAVLTVAAAGTPSRTVAVSLTIADGAPVLAVSAVALDVRAALGENAASQTLSVRNAGSGTLIYAIAADQPWLSVTPASGTSIGESDALSVSFSTAGMPAGTHRASLTVSAAGLAPKQIPVTLSLTAQRVRGDLDGDGHSDALFRHTDGTLAGFLMNGTTVLTDVAPASLYSFWDLDATGDFDGDGKSFDVLWVQPFSGAAMIAQNDGATQKALGGIGSVDSDWTISGVADFDGDGKSDLLWLDPGSGVLTLWLVDGLRVKRAEAVGTLVPGWVVAATGDFDADGKADVLLENVATQQRLLWIFDGSRVRLSFAPSMPDQVFRTAGSGDFDGDGKTDIVVSYDAFGFVAVLSGNGAGFTPSNRWALALGSPRMTTGDYDGDGKDDLFFYDPVTGKVTMTLTQGAQFANPALIGSLDPSWSLVGEKGTAR